MVGFSKIVRAFDKENRLETGGFGYASLESVDNQIVCLMRMLLAISALIITIIDPTTPERFVEITYTVLIAYCIYSAILYFLARQSAEEVLADIIPWADMTWYLVFIALSNGSSSIYFFFFFFSILVAAFRSGFNAGLSITIVSTLLFAVIGYATAQKGQEFELNRFLIRPVYLMMLGYMIAYWGGQEIKFKRHLVLLKDVNRLSNPRFGVDRTLSHIMNRLREFYDAESCILITFDSSSDTYNWREATREKASEEIQAEQTRAAVPLIKLPGDRAILYENNTKPWYFTRKCYAYDVSTGAEADGSREVCAAIADLLDIESFLTVPVMQHGEMIGRLYLTSRENCFGRSELEFVTQLIEQVLRAVENVELVDRLATLAADRQRKKISRDLHDSTIQPYVGLKLGLEALEIKHAAGAPIDKDIEKLINLTNATIGELRGYVSDLKSETTAVKTNVLIQAIKQQAVKFKEFYDVSIAVRAADDFYLNDRLAAEVFQIVSEGLSNIKRHTKAKNGLIALRRDSEKLFLEIENEHDNREPIADFVPKSIAGRAESLGGTARVERSASRTKILVEIPL
jgi:signal transduction histidine kinase